MSTAVFAESRRAIGDISPLLKFRLSHLGARGRRVASISLAITVALTVGIASIPGYSHGAVTSQKAGDLLILLPSVYFAFLVTSSLAIVGAGGGRELLPRDQAMAFPVSPTTDHLGALLLAPLNVAWILQAWTLLGITAYVVGPHGLLFAQLTVVGWLFACTAIGQSLAWCIEWIRRGAHGVALTRVLGLMLAVGAVALVVTGEIGKIFDASPTLWIVEAVFDGSAGLYLRWLAGVAVIAAMLLVAVVIGSALSHAVAKRVSREEAKAESRHFAARPMPKSDFAALVAIDRGSIFRSVPLRRGFFVLAVLPGLVAAAGQLTWDMLPILPGLVGAGGALLFGVNAWCLDGVGALWRDSLPVDPKTMFYARVRVLTEVLVGATVLTLVVASLRAQGAPTGAQLASVLTAAVVVCVQVVARSMQWSVRRPYAMDLRSARGTPAPPFAMLGYSAWLAISSTMTGLIFTVTARAPDARAAIIVGLPFLLAALRRIAVTAAEWEQPLVRARVIATVAAR